MFPFAIASRGSFRRQLILTFVVGFFGLAVTFAAFMVANERANLYRNGRAAATGLVQSLAISARSWVLANDVIGMQEVVQAFSDYPDLRYVMIVSPSGRVLAHNDTTKVGQYVADERSLALLKAQQEQQVMRDDDEVIEVAVPIVIGERQVGWARVALGREAVQRGLYELVGSIASFVLVITVLFFFAALFMVNRLGRRIGSLVEVARAVQAGDFAKRVMQLPGQEDEINRLAGSLNLMLDTLSRNEEQLRSVSQYTRSLIEASLDPLVTISPEGKITDVNLATEMATGRSRDELVGTDFSEYFTEPDKARAGYRQVFEQGSVTNYPLAIRHRDGHISTVLYNASVYRNEEGVVQGVFAAARDISEQQRAVLLRAQLAAIVESSSDAIIGKTLDGTITSWNKGAEKVYGYRAEEIIGKPVTLLAPADQQASIQQLLETVRNGGTVLNHESERVRKDGTRITVSLTLSPIRDASGKVSGVSTIARDISERKRAEEQIRQSEMKYRSLIQNIQAAIVVHAPDTRILIANSQAQEILGLSAEQMQGKLAIDPDWHFFREDGKPAALEEYPVNRVLASGQAIRNLVIGVHRPNCAADVWVLVNADPVFDKSGAIAQVIVTFIDISERKQMEAALRESEERFHGMFEKHHAVMLLIAPDTGKIIDANPAAASFYGYPLDTLRGMAIQEINMLTPEQIAQERQRAVHEERNYFVFPHRLASGEIRTVEVHSSPITVGGKPILFSITHDITERKQAEDSLKRMNERFELATRAASLGVWDWDIPKNELVWDDRMYALYGIKREDFAGAYDAWLKGVHPDDRIRGDEAIQMALRGEGEFDTEFRVLWPDGSVHVIKAFGRIVRDAEGKPLRMTGINFDITERKQAEEALRREQALLNRIMVTSPVGIAVVSKEGQVTFANPQAEKIMGLSKEEITQRSYNAPAWHITAFDGGPFPDEELPFSRVMATGRPVFDVQHAIVWPDGHRVLLTINGAPLFDAQGAIEGVAFAIEDITQRKLADEELRRNEHSLIEAQRIAHLGSWHMDLATNEVFWSEELYKMYGFDPALPPPLYTESMKLFTPESWERLSNAIARAVETGISYELELEMVPRNGGSKWMWARGELVRDEHGKAIEVRGVVMDITERKLAELALLEQQAHSKSLLRLSRRLERAQSYAEILAAAGDEVREMIGYRNLWVYLLSDDGQYFTALIGTGESGSLSTKEEGAPRLTIAGDRMMEQIAAAKEIVIIEDAQTSDIVNREIVQKLGNRTIVNIPIILFDRHLGTVGVGTFGDEGVRVPSPSEQKYLLAMASHLAAALDRIYLLNERRKAEQEVQELNRDLEQRVAERTEQLEAANKELESFSYSVSHDLRSPLRAIDGFSHILLEDYTDKLDDDGKRMLGIVRDNTLRMGQLIDDILKLSRSGRSEINTVEVDMAALAREVLDELQVGVSKIANLRCEIGDLPPARCDRALMHQVFANLLSNALKFSRTRETPTIEVGGAIQGDEIVYHVKDNGVGFDMQYADKLFGVFQRLHSVEEFEGTGIGLAIVKRIVMRHGGRVWAEGKLEEGATMYFTLPRSGEHEGSPAI